MQVNRRVIAVLCIAVAASGILVTLAYEGVFNSVPFNGTTVHFTIIEATTGPLEGMNGSAYYPQNTPWPVLQVNQGDRVVIHIMNNSTSGDHGFAIDHYFPSGVSITPQRSYDKVFIANQAGSFRVYCDVVCPIHPLMQNGLLVVNAQPS